LRFKKEVLLHIKLCRVEGNPTYVIKMFITGLKVLSQLPCHQNDASPL
jgi:hypothetical protein